jgi:hypothetical protein
MIISIIGLACLANLAVDVGQHFNLPEKPFRCDMCMGFWISVLPLTLLYGFKGFCSAGIVAVLANIIFKLNEKI